MNTKPKTNSYCPVGLFAWSVCIAFIKYTENIRKEFICLILVSGTKCVRLQLSSGCEPLALTLQTGAGRGANTATSQTRRRAAAANKICSTTFRGSFCFTFLQQLFPLRCWPVLFVRALSKRQSIGHEHHCVVRRGCRITTRQMFHTCWFESLQCCLCLHFQCKDKLWQCEILWGLT